MTLEEIKKLREKNINQHFRGKSIRTGRYVEGPIWIASSGNPVIIDYRLNGYSVDLDTLEAID